MVSMLPLQSWPLEFRRSLVGVMTDIDDTLTTDGAITPDALAALAALKAAGLHVIAITGRPVGWSAPFAATWPVDAIVAENGAVALLQGAGHESTHGKNSRSGPSDGPEQLSKRYQQDATTRTENFARMQTGAPAALREPQRARRGLYRSGAGGAGCAIGTLAANQ